jgi:hypothetical protein
VKTLHIPLTRGTGVFVETLPSTPDGVNHGADRGADASPAEHTDRNRNRCAFGIRQVALTPSPHAAGQPPDAGADQHGHPE